MPNMFKVAVDEGRTIENNNVVACSQDPEDLLWCSSLIFFFSVKKLRCDKFVLDDILLYASASEL